MALFACTCHVVDIGGRGFGPDGRQVFEEGLFIPVMKLAREGRVSEDLLALVRANVREPDQVEGDLYSYMASNDAGCDRLGAMLAEFGLAGIEDLADRGITTGCAPGLYCPTDVVRRKQMAVFLLKTLEGSSYAPSTPTGIFDDVPADSFRPWIEDLYNRGITGGCSGGPPPAPISYCPENAVTRGLSASVRKAVPPSTE